MNTSTNLSTYSLLPAVHRLRDGQQGGPLEALLCVIDEQVQHVVANTRQMYDDWFIETCSPELVPYIGELLGGSVSANILPVGLAGSSLERAMRLTFPRREVSNAVSLQKRKGTLPVLEELAMSVARWHARAEEWYPRVAQFQDVRRLNQADAEEREELLAMGQTVDFRKLRANGRLEGPFDQGAYFSDFRPATEKYFPKNRKLLRLHLWRLNPYRMTQVRPRCVLGCDTFKGKTKVFALDPAGTLRTLCVKPQWEEEQTTIAGEVHLPLELTFHRLGGLHNEPSEKYYGRNKSLELWLESEATQLEPQAHTEEESGRTLIPRECIVIADLSWAICKCNKTGHGNETPQVKTWPEVKLETLQSSMQPKDLFSDPPKHWVAVDPVHGLMAINVPSEHPEFPNILASYHVLFSGDMGGGEYVRPANSYGKKANQRVRIRRGRRGKTADEQLIELILGDQVGKTLIVDKGDFYYEILQSGHTVVEITDSDTYQIPKCTIEIPAGCSLEIRAAKGCFPTLEIDGTVCNTGIEFVFGSGSQLILNGLKLFGGRIACRDLPPSPPIVVNEQAKPLVVSPQCSPCREPAKDLVNRITLQHCTLVPNCGSVGGCCSNTSPTSFENTVDHSILTIDHSIVGLLLVPNSSNLRPKRRLQVLDSIVDGQSGGGVCDKGMAIQASDSIVRVERSTVFGFTEVQELELAQDSIFSRPVTVGRRQPGGLRFCYVPGQKSSDKSRIGELEWQTPQQFYCQPSQALERFANNDSSCPKTVPADLETLSQQDVPLAFSSVCYGEGAYGQLHTTTGWKPMPHLACCCDCEEKEKLESSQLCSPLIVQGAESGSEMGAFHDLYQPQRTDNLRRRIDEFTPMPMHTEIRFES